MSLSLNHRLLIVLVVVAASGPATVTPGRTDLSQSRALLDPRGSCCKKIPIIGSCLGSGSHHDLGDLAAVGAKDFEQSKSQSIGEKNKFSRWMVQHEKD